MQGTIQSTMIRASAGSGKTWQLANRFLALMVLGIAPEKIIALTFTRKAAAEFTGRIMSRLAEAANHEQGAKKLSSELQEILHGTENIPALVTAPLINLPKTNTAFFQQKLEELIAAFDRLALSTLDSYFVRIVRNFAYELGLSGFELMEDTAIATQRMSVMTTLFSNQETRKAERQAFLQSFKQATWGEEENRLCKTLDEFIKKHQNRWLSAPEAERWGEKNLLWPPETGGCPYPKGDIKKKARLLRKLLGEPVSPHKIYINGWLKVCDLLENYTPGTPVNLNAQLSRAIPLWREYTGGGLIEEKNKFEISPELGAAMTELIGTYIKSEIELQLKRTQGLYSVINAYEESYHQHVRSRGRLCFSDLTLLLAGEGAMKIWDEESRNLIDYRLDAKYDHWLLDEFQDTSQPQWQAIGNLIDEIMQDPEGERSVFVVGDSKQSIYGWRGGEPRLFDDLQKHYGDRLAEWHMDRSFRSSQRVLDLVNTVCDLSNEKWSGIFPPAAIDRWIYHTHEPDRDKSGHSLVLETAIDSTSSPEEKTAARYACVQSLLEKIDPLGKGLSCAILVSKNAHVTEIVNFLRSEMPGLAVASESESIISDGPEGAAVLDLFRWLKNPSHYFGRIHIQLSPLGKIISDLTKTNNPDTQWHRLTEQIARYGIEPLVIKIIHALRTNLTISAYGLSRLNEILTAAGDFSTQGGNMRDWINLLETRSIRETTREGVIQVMTVHKCKGLGFDIVLLPELGSGKQFTDSGRLDALEKKGDLGVTEYIIKKPTKEICQADATLKLMLDSWQADQCYERFCNLYVALTRAARATYCIIDPVRDSWKCGQKYDDWIREATSSFSDRKMEMEGAAYNIIYESGQWLGSEDGSHVREIIQETEAELQLATPRMGRKVASGSKKYQAGAILHNGKGMRFGSLVHQHFEKITWLDELPDLGSQSAAKIVLECLKSETIRGHFERPNTDFQLLREQPFETQHKGQWISGIIDRAVITLQNGKPTHVTIIDFKTDSREDAEALREKYADQLETYRQALAEITGLAKKNITCLLLSTSLKEMVEIPFMC